MNRGFSFISSFILLVFLAASFSAKASAAVVINEIYGAGGNTGSVYNQDFVELYNNGTANVDISGFSLQYAAATGITYSVCAITATDTIIEPGTYFLIATGTANAAQIPALPTPNASCSVSPNTISMSATSGKVALVSNTTVLSGTISCPTTGITVVDYVGYGSTANCYEGTGPAPSPGTATSIQRKLFGTDTNNNNVDFEAVTPTPQAAGTTAASAFIGGRVTTTGGRGISKAKVIISGGNLEQPRYAVTNAFGYYRFEELSAGETFVLQVVSKGYKFANQNLVVNLQDNLSDINFVGEFVQEGSK
jgi:hypothetical protein